MSNKALSLLPPCQPVTNLYSQGLNSLQASFLAHISGMLASQKPFSLSDKLQSVSYQKSPAVYWFCSYLSNQSNCGSFGEGMSPTLFLSSGTGFLSAFFAEIGLQGSISLRPRSLNTGIPKSPTWQVLLHLILQKYTTEVAPKVSRLCPRTVRQHQKWWVVIEKKNRLMTKASMHTVLSSCPMTSEFSWSFTVLSKRCRTLLLKTLCISKFCPTVCTGTYIKTRRDPFPLVVSS